MTPAEAARRFFEGAMHMWVSAPHFKGVESSMSLNDWFDASLREHLPVIARKRGAEEYVSLLRDKTEQAYSQYEKGETDAGRQTMVELLDLIHTHLHLPNKRQISELLETSRSPD